MPERKRHHADIDQATDNFKEGVNNRSARDWVKNAKANAEFYEEDFKDTLEKQNECADDMDEDAGGYQRLAQYANCLEGEEA